MNSRLTGGAVRAALVPLGTCVAALLLLTAYTATGAAGDPPPRISVSNGRIFMPSNPQSTAAFFDISNTGAAEDVLESVSSPELGITMFNRRVTKDGAGRMESLNTIRIPAGGVVRMSPYSVDVMIYDPPKLKPGDKVPFDLWFRYSGRVRVDAVATPPQW
ncbi:copper chaperone PCu(A)C [Streptomyces tuirus]|uniref:Copper chaperone PCu(A)C n=1 Tax=Streptomyces tuirus TaxID=68278 RepID=A0A941FF35_9ACTN|nr:copper chaperone PCu(A)C [Streptomyces tuirus]